MALALLAGWALSYAYAPSDIGFLAWFFPAVHVALLWSLPRVEGQKAHRKNFWRGFRLSAVVGAGFWGRDVAFVGAVSQQGGWVSSGALALYLSLFFAVYGGWVSAFGRPKHWRREKNQPAFSILSLAASHGFLWCGLEWLRGLTRLSFGWDGLGVSFLESGFVMAQAADLVGVNGLSFLPVFGGVVLVQTLLSFHYEALHNYRRVHWEVGATLLILCSTFFYGVFRLRQLHASEVFPLNALIVQQNVPLSFNWNPELASKVYEGFSGEMERAFTEMEEVAASELLERGETRLQMPEIVLWPESAFPNPMWVGPEGQVLAGQENEHFFTEAVRPYGDFLFITGVNQFPAVVEEESYIMNPEGPFYNAVGFFSDGFTSYQYKAKHHLMPFGEYMPLEDFSLFQLAYEYSAGITFGGSFSPATVFDPQTVTLRGEELSLIPTVCYEDSVSRAVRKYVRDEPQVIINVTNDGWFAGTSCAEKHYQNARYRAIEYRRPLMRAANTGVSGIVNLTGASSHPDTLSPQELRDAAGSSELKGSLSGVVLVPREAVMTLYSRLGDVLCWGGGLVTLGWTVLRGIKGEGE